MPLLLLVRMAICTYLIQCCRSSSQWKLTNLKRCVFLYSMYAILLVIFPSSSRQRRYRYFKNHLQKSRKARLQFPRETGSPGRAVNSSGRWLGPVTSSTLRKKYVLHSANEQRCLRVRSAASCPQFLPRNYLMTFLVMQPQMFLSQSHLLFTFSFFIVLKTRSPPLPSPCFSPSAEGLLTIMVGVMLCMGSQTRVRSRSGTQLTWGRNLPMKESADLLREMLRNISFCSGFMPAESLRSMFYSDDESFTLLFITYCLFLYSNC